MKKRTIALVLACILCVGIGIGGTLAWLTAQTGPVKNTFTTSDIGVTLTESDSEQDTDKNPNTNSYQMIPGWTIAKDPAATVTTGSEDCFLFVKVEKSSTFDTYMNYAIDDEWTPLDEVKNPGVYYIKIDQNAKKNVSYNILGAGKATYDDKEYTWADNQVLVKPTVTKTLMNNLAEANAIQPTLTFTAYASQLWKTNNPGTDATEAEIAAAQFTPAEAWANVPTA
ncbi:hypothetical protein [Dysosmobacter sp.]|uniref:hypothetical protein n=1 Tax=Dysosmobacter sp. TaxID=2591382 RepID=UPI002A8AEE62|nr:hypothetical protein [Dysosmobacter sp.]MDY3986191.1 hypothetical protein [Dysosmobacter sp.]